MCQWTPKHVKHFAHAPTQALQRQQSSAWKANKWKRQINIRSTVEWVGTKNRKLPCAPPALPCQSACGGGTFSLPAVCCCCCSYIFKAATNCFHSSLHSIFLTFRFFNFIPVIFLSKMCWRILHFLLFFISFIIYIFFHFIVNDYFLATFNLRVILKSNNFGAP